MPNRPSRCWVCSGDPTVCRCPENPACFGWERIAARDLPHYRGWRVSVGTPHPEEVPDRLISAVINPAGTGVDIVTRDGRCTLAPLDFPVWIQPDPYPTTPTEVGDQFTLPI